MRYCYKKFPFITVQRSSFFYLINLGIILEDLVYHSDFYLNNHYMIVLLLPCGRISEHQVVTAVSGFVRIRKRCV